MVTTRHVEPLDKSLLEEVGMSWHTDSDGSDYICDELVLVGEEEAEAYYAAANALYDMFVEAAQHAIDNRLYYELGIASNLVNLIEESWERDDWHLYGRFDLAGGVDGAPIKLLEFNADTPTGLFETSIVQWAILKANGMDESLQFNNIQEMLKENFRRLVTGDGDAEFEEIYASQKLLFSSVRDLPEEERTVSYLQSVARDAGFYTDFCYLDEVGFIADQGVFNRDHQLADFWFKLYPWEDIASDELELTRILEKISRRGHTRFINPAYTLLFQSKGMLKLLWDLFPESPYLLPTSFEPLEGIAQVEKKMYGREGANTRIVAADGKTVAQTDGPYAHHKSVYQQFVELPQDSSGNRYQAGVFYIWEACGLGFRRGDVILDNMSKFAGHLVTTQTNRLA